MIATADSGDRHHEATQRAWQGLRRRLGRAPEQHPSVGEWLGHGGRSLGEVLTLTAAIARALADRHRTGNLLLDLRAETVRVDDRGQVHLSGPGLASGPRGMEVGYHPSAADAILDASRCMAPEQVNGEGLDPRSDLFALGTLLYEMVTGRAPFAASTPLATASRIVSLEPPSAMEVEPAVSPDLSGLIDRLLAKDPDDRPSSAAAVARELDAILASADAAAGRGDSGTADPAAEIERLYDEIVALSRRGGDGAKQEALEAAYGRLLEMQEAESRVFRQRFESSLEMPIDAGEHILEQARALREELEDLVTQDPAATQADKTPAPAKAV